MSRERFYCIGYAGYKASVFDNWLNSEHDIIPLEMRGRGHRKTDIPYSDFNKIVDEYVDEIDMLNQQADFKAYTILGHSAGAIFAYAIVKQLEKKKKLLPKRLIIIGMSPDDYCENNIEDMNSNEFVEWIAEVGYIPNDILRHKGLASLFTKDIKQDILMIQQYKMEVPISIDILSLSGNNEDLETEMKKWKNYTTGSFSCLTYLGDHFSLYQNLDVLNLILNFNKEDDKIE